MSIYLNSTIKKKEKKDIDHYILSTIRILRRNAVITRTTNPRKTDTDIVQRRLAGNLNDKQCIARGLTDILKCQWLPTRDSTRRLVPVAIVSTTSGRTTIVPSVRARFLSVLSSLSLSLPLSPIPIISIQENDQREN